MKLEGGRPYIAREGLLVLEDFYGTSKRYTEELPYGISEKKISAIFSLWIELWPVSVILYSWHISVSRMCRKGFLTKHPKCGVLSCSQRKKLEFCYQCGEFPCEKYDGVKQSDSFITHFNQLKDMDKAKTSGIDVYLQELNERISILEMLLETYDDGRRKSFFCIALNLLTLDDLKKVVEQIEFETYPEQTLKERAAIAVRLLQAMAETQEISLKLRKK